MPSLSEIGDLTIITPCLVLHGLLMDTLLNSVSLYNFHLYSKKCLQSDKSNEKIESEGTFDLRTGDCTVNFSVNAKYKTRETRERKTK